MVDAAGNLWCAMFGAGAVVGFNAEGEEIKRLSFDAPQTTCPAFGGSDLSTLYCTSAARDMPSDDGKPHGAVFAVHELGRGQAEHQVIL